MSNLAYIAVVTVGAFRVLVGPLSLGELQAFMRYIRQIGQPVSQLGNMAAQVQSALASAERVFELLDAPVLIQKTLNELRVGRTSFVIAHRLSTIHGADVIVCMEAGNVREVGPMPS